MDSIGNAAKEFYEEKLFLTHHVTNDFVMAIPHFHDGFEIYLTMTDDTVFYVDSYSFNLKKGGMALVNNNEVHRTQPPQGGYERYIISFMAEYISELNLGEENLLDGFINHQKSDNHCMQLSDSEVLEFIAYFNVLQQCIQQNDLYAKELKKKLVLAQILILCNQCFRKSNAAYLPGKFYMKLSPILAYIKSHLESDLSLDRISADFYISKSHLIRIFKTEIGMTPNEYIIMLRIMASRQFLKENMPIIRVCELIGYSDESHFIRTFKKIIGLTPKQYAIMKNR